MMIGAVREQMGNVKAEDFRYLPSAEKWLRNRGWEAKGPADQETDNIFLQMLRDKQ